MSNWHIYFLGGGEPRFKYFLIMRVCRWGVALKKLQVPVAVLMKGSAEALRAARLTAIMIVVKVLTSW
jgi:hypothetical protein